MTHYELETHSFKNLYLETFSEFSFGWGTRDSEMNKTSSSPQHTQGPARVTERESSNYIPERNDLEAHKGAAGAWWSVLTKRDALF